MNLDEIKQRAEKATPGPWVYFPGEFNTANDTGDHHGSVKSLADDWWIAAIDNVLDERETQANGVFIASAREDVLALVAEVERLRAELARLNERVERERNY